MAWDVLFIFAWDIYYYPCINYYNLLVIKLPTY